MPTLIALLKTQIRKIAAAEVRKASRRLQSARRQLKALRVAVRRQSAAVTRLGGRIDRLRARLASGPRRPRAGATPARPRRRRSADAAVVFALRRRLKLSRAALAKLLRVSRWSIFAWETGRTTPSGRNVARVRALARRGTPRRRTPRGRKRR